MLVHYRIQVKGKNRVGIQALAFHDIAIQLEAAERKNEKVPICITVGNSPLVTYMASTPVMYTQNEYEFVGALQDGVPHRLFSPIFTKTFMFQPAQRLF